ncbi:hypothetical protein [Pseudonocardia lacus]|uniref:hypothetical protein n=1 Tax=Pseudonocardia lacus TaxID=2835865 RepID=UPI001BDD79B9|nr:hypothetical protein [Pseudonocardia lacus]
MSHPPGPFEDQPTEHLFVGAPAAGTTTDDPDDDLLEPDWDQPRRFSRLTVALAIGILVVLAFAGGAFVAGAASGPAGAACYPPATTTGG